MGSSLQFDVETEQPRAIDVRVQNGCAELDLYFDGRHRPDLVRVGPNSRPPKSVPFERCP
jgi:hypothetical protein